MQSNAITVHRTFTGNNEERVEFNPSLLAPLLLLKLPGNWISGWTVSSPGVLCSDFSKHFTSYFTSQVNACLACQCFWSVFVFLAICRDAKIPEEGASPSFTTYGVYSIESSRRRPGCTRCKVLSCTERIHYLNLQSPLFFLSRFQWGNGVNSNISDWDDKYQRKL